MDNIHGPKDRLLYTGSPNPAKSDSTGYQALQNLIQRGLVPWWNQIHKGFRPQLDLILWYLKDREWF